MQTKKPEWIVGADGKLDAATVRQARTAAQPDGVAMLLEYLLQGQRLPSIEQFVLPPELAIALGQGLLDAAHELGEFQKPRH